MTRIARNIAGAPGCTYDLIIIGGGVYGTMLCLEASKRGLRSLLLEKKDFGGATTFNHLRTIHGGFRYLQTMDFHRYRESVAERRWWLRTFPSFIVPLGCLMPLYGRGLRRTSVLRVGARMNDFFSRNRNRGVTPDAHLPETRIITAEETRELFPSVDIQGLQGGVLWHDARVTDSQRLLIEILRWCCENGATALNYVEVRHLLQADKQVAGVLAVDADTGESQQYKAGIVVNAAGPWCRQLAEEWDQGDPDLFRSSVAWNVLLNRELLSPHAVAVSPNRPGSQTYFLLPWKGRILAGTGHAQWQGTVEYPTPSDQLIQEFLDDLNHAVPSLAVDQGDIVHVLPGLLPVVTDGTRQLRGREVIRNHADHGGPRGLYTVSGVKFTTARLVAEKALRQVFPERTAGEDNMSRHFLGLYGTARLQGLKELENPSACSHQKSSLRTLVEEEAVRHLGDLILRRTPLWENPREALVSAPELCRLFPWDESRCKNEINMLREELSRTINE